MADQLPLDQIQVDQDNLYREQAITDLRVASIRQLIPIKIDGTDDPSRETMYVASTQIMSQMGPLPVTAPIEASNLQDAITQFPEAIKEAVDRMIEEAKEQRRQESSRIVVPGQGGMPGAGGPPGGGIISG
ncbi:MAG: hypothetical protein HOE48_13500 [Candidatus Latescibacteria bacterium]|jgi:hypothetical protein|nr:hypothetical protein [Candidatus Latescibacterota bacterium]MBT4138929.1 hypothetical protein [Candidatus Latescibacterota bacterium]